MGCIFWRILACGGGGNPWPNWIDFLSHKNQAYHNQSLGELLGAKLAMGWEGNTICGNKEKEEKSTFGRGCKAWPNGDQVAHCDGFAKLHFSTTP